MAGEDEVAVEDQAVLVRTEGAVWAGGHPSGDGRQPTGAAVVVPSRRGRPLGVLVDGPDGPRWQRTVDVEALVRLGILAAAAVGMATAARRPSARVDRLSMGPGGWVSFKGFPAPKARWDRRPWWARLLRAHRVS